MLSRFCRTNHMSNATVICVIFFTVKFKQKSFVWLPMFSYPVLILKITLLFHTIFCIINYILNFFLNFFSVSSLFKSLDLFLGKDDPSSKRNLCSAYVWFQIKPETSLCLVKYSALVWTCNLSWSIVFFVFSNFHHCRYDLCLNFFNCFPQWQSKWRPRTQYCSFLRKETWFFLKLYRLFLVMFRFRWNFHMVGQTFDRKLKLSPVSSLVFCLLPPMATEGTHWLKMLLPCSSFSGRKEL